MPAFLFLCVIPGSVSPVSPPGGGGRFPAGTPVHPPSSPPKARAGRSTPRPLLHRHLPPLFPAHRFVDPRDAARSGHLFRSLNGFIDLDAPDGGSAAPAGGIYLLTVKAGDSKGLRRLEAQGLNLLAPFGPEAYLVEGRDGTVLPGSIRLPRGSRLVPFSPEFIVDSSIGQPPVRSPQAARRPTLALQVGLIPGFDAAAVAQELQARGAVIRQVEQRPGSIAIIRFDLPYAGILPLVRAVPGLFRVEEDHLFQVAGEEVSSTMQAGEFFNGTAPFWDAGVDGGGGGLVPAQVIAVTDTGLSYDALHFSDTPTSAGTPGAAHSKLQAYVAVGGGDLMSCDAPASGGSTHGNVVAGVAAGNVSRFGIDLRSNQGWESAFTPFAADGVARGARVVFQDAQVQSFCAAAFDILSPGNLFDRMSEAKAMGAAVQNFSFSAQNTKAVYNLDSINVDSFLRQNRDYMTVIAVGNEGSDFDGDGNYEYGSITAPATAKNAIGVGASNSANEPINPFDPTQALSPGVPNDGVNLLAVFAEGTTGRGPAIFPSRVKPDLMAPGQDEFPNLRLDGPVVCRSSDDDNITAAGGVECILDDDNDGTSFAAAAVTGAAALVRDYFAQGFADDGSPGGPEVGRNLSGAAVKAVLLASAQFMRVSPGFNFDLSTPRFDVPDLSGRFNFEQGYGRVNLSKILPLATDAQSPTGLLLEDQGLAGGLVTGGSFSRTLTVLDPTQELRIALVWMDPPDLSGSGRLINDLDLEVTDHGPDNILGTADDVLYRGNFFTEDQGSFDGFLLLSDPNFPLIPGEDSDGDGILDESAFSLPVFTSIRNFHDRDNPNEAVFLSPDPNHDGNPADSQLAAGQKITVQVDAHQVTSPFETVVSAGGNGVLETTPSGDDLQGPGPTINAGADGVADSAAAGDDIQVVAVGQTAPQPFALVMGGGFVQTSSLRMNASRYLCNDLVQVILLDPTPGLQLADVAAAVSLKVMAPGGAILDSENSFSFSEPQPGSGRFVSLEEPVIDGVAAVPDDSILSVVDGAELVAQYTDADGPVVTFKASVSCQPDIGLAKVSRPGTNLSYSVRGGCDTPPRRDPRGILSGFPPRPSGDLFLDAGEILDYKVAVLNREEQADLIDAVATLRAVFPDGDNASDPARLNNLPADNGPGRKVRILQPTRDVGLIPRGSLQAISFGIVVQPNVSFPEQIEMVFGLSAKRNGLSTEFTSVFLHTLNMDEESFAYSTDFPTGGMETRVNAGEFLNLGPGLEPQTFVFQDATTTAFGGGNPQWASTAPEPKAPWTFDLNDEGFTTSRRFDSSPGLNSQLNLNLWHWANTGECGFQSNDPSQPDPDFSNPQNIIRGRGGIWHTGTIGTDPPNPARKQANGRNGFDLGCEDYDTPADSGTPTNEQILDVLSSPVFHRVHVNPDANGFAYTLEFTRFAFNQQVDLADSNVLIGWELDPDTTTPDPVDPLDFSWLGEAATPRGFLTGLGQIPYPTFDPNNPHEPGTVTGTGPQGSGSIGSFWDPNDTAKAPSRFLGAIGGSGFGTLQQRGAGGLPLRNVEEMLDGFFGGNTDFEDIFGPNENSQAIPPIRRDDFQVNFAMFVRENADPSMSTFPSYGMGVDDVVVEWVEKHPVADQEPCTSLGTGNPAALGSCARIMWDRAVVYEAEDSAVLSVLDPDAAVGPDGVGGTGDEQAVDSDGDGFFEVQVRVTSDVDLAGELVTLEQTALLSDVYFQVVQLSTTTGLNSSQDGVIFMQQNGRGTSPVVILARYNDADNGTGQPCPDNPLKATMSTQFVGGNILFVTAKVTDLNGDMDGLPDANERVHLDLSLVSNMLDSADNPVVLENTRIFLSSTDPDVACILDNVAAFGDLTPGVVATNPAGDGFEFVVAPVNRLATSQLIRATFTLGISGTFVDIAGRQRTVSSFATPQRFSLNLDLDLPVAVTPVPDFTENWDSVQAGGDGLNSFTSGPVFPTNDASTVDGSRCQYHDPDGPNPEGGGRDPSICRPWPGSDWHVMTPANAPVAKAFSGDGALLMGTHEVGQDASFDSYTSGQLSFAMSPVLNIGVSGGSTLSFRHIVALADDRLFSIPAGEAADRAVVQVAQADPFSGSIASAWETIPAFQNNYTNQGTDSFINCQFDPVDDFYDTFSAVPGADLFLPQNIDGVSTEDDYFDPNDPERRLGPSSTCFPQFVFAFMGDWTSNDPAKSGNAFVLGSTGSRGGGIWVESRFNLDAYAGESIRVRLLFSGLELGGPTGARWVNLFGNQLGNATRGWVVDDFRVSGLVNIPTPLSTDSKPPPPPVCPVDPDPTTPANEAACGTAVADAGPDQVSPAPGFLVSLDGSASSLDACVDGFIEYRWRLNGRTVQDWSNESRFRDNPVFSSVYELDVRCSVDPACSAVKSITVTMGGKLAEVSQGSGAAEFQVGHAPPRILTGADGIAQTQVLPGSDDIQVTPQGLTGTVAVSAGPDGILQTMVPAGDDVLADYGARLDWNGVGPGFGYDIQRIDIDAFDPVPLREDPLAAPPGSLPVSRMCRLAQTGEAVLSFVEETLAPSPGQVIGYLINSRRLVDGVPGQLGAGLTAGGLRLSRPGAVSTSCP